MSLRDQLQGIYDKHGKLTPAIVVDEARDEEHPLHDRFEWDDAVAGEQWRREQAHQLIRQVKVVYKPATEDRAAEYGRAFHAIRSDQGHVFEPHEHVIANPFLTELVLRDMEREWKQLQARYGQFAEFVAMVRRDLTDIAA